MERKRTILLPLLVCATLILAACGGGTTPSSVGTNAGAASASQSTPQNQSSGDYSQSAAGASSGSAAGGSTADSANALSRASTSAAAAPAAESLQAGSTASMPPPTFNEHAPPTASDEPYDSTYYQNYGVNPFVDTTTDALSTFAMDIDTASVLACQAQAVELKLLLPVVERARTRGDIALLCWLFDGCTLAIRDRQRRTGIVKRLQVDVARVADELGIVTALAVDE